jgi:hypothetical protein
MVAVHNLAGVEDGKSASARFFSSPHRNNDLRNRRIPQTHGFSIEAATPTRAQCGLCRIEAGLQRLPSEA